MPQKQKNSCRKKLSVLCSSILPQQFFADVMSKMLQWRFEKINGAWYWMAGASSATDDPFPTFIACLIDAQEHGLFAKGHERRHVAETRRPPIERRSAERATPQGFAPLLIGH